MNSHWEKDVASLDREIRRSNLRWKRNVVRVGQSVELITDERTLPLDGLNALKREARGDLRGYEKVTSDD